MIISQMIVFTYNNTLICKVYYKKNVCVCTLDNTILNSHSLMGMVIFIHFVHFCSLFSIAFSLPSFFLSPFFPPLRQQNGLKVKSTTFMLAALLLTAARLTSQQLKMTTTYRRYYRLDMHTTQPSHHTITPGVFFMCMYCAHTCSVCVWVWVCGCVVILCCF